MKEKPGNYKDGVAISYEDMNSYEDTHYYKSKEGIINWLNSIVNIVADKSEDNLAIEVLTPTGTRVFLFPGDVITMYYVEPPYFEFYRNTKNMSFYSHREDVLLARAKGYEPPPDKPKETTPRSICDWYLLEDNEDDHDFPMLLYFSTECGETMSFGQLEETLFHKYCRSCGGKVTTRYFSGKSIQI